MEFKRVSRWIEVKYTLKGNPYFDFRKRRYHLGNVNTTCPVLLRCRNNMWSAFNNDELPSYIHGYSSESYNPIFVEISDSGEAVRIYEHINGTYGE